MVVLSIMPSISFTEMVSLRTERAISWSKVIFVTFISFFLHAPKASKAKTNKNQSLNFLHFFIGKTLLFKNYYKNKSKICLF